MGNQSVIISEQMIINLCLNNPSYIEKIQDNYFLSDIAQVLFNTIKVLDNENKPLNDENIILYAKNDLINRDILNNLRNISFDVNDFNIYYQTLKEAYAKEDLVKYQREIYLNSESKSQFNLVYIKKLRDKLDENIGIIENDGKKSQLLTPEQAMSEYEIEMHKKFVDMNSYSTGCHYLDQALIYKASPGMATTFFGPSGCGKSAFTLYLDKCRMNREIPTLRVDIENPLKLTIDRVLSDRQKYPAQLLNHIKEEDEELIRELIKHEKEYVSKNKRFFYAFCPGIDLSGLDDLVVEALKTMKANYLVLTIDLASMISDFGEQPDQIMKAMNKLHIMLLKRNIHANLVFQSNRELENKKIEKLSDIKNLIPQRKHLYGGDAMWQRSRVVISLFREKYYREQFFSEDPTNELIDDVAKISIIKQNGGPLRTLKYLFNPTYFNFLKYVEKNDENECKESVNETTN